MNSLPKIVTRQRRGCDLNAGPSAPESSTLTTRLPIHPIMELQRYYVDVNAVMSHDGRGRGMTEPRQEISTACITQTTSRAHSSPSIGSGTSRRTAKDGRAHVHVQGHSWNCAVIPESTGSCRRSTWSAFPPLCCYQLSAGAIRQTVHRRPSRSPDQPLGTVCRTM